MSDTPRTIAFIERILDKDGVVEEENAPFVWVRLCKELERELTAAKAENAAMREAINGVYKILQSIQCNDIFEDTMRNYAVIALSKLQPFLKP